MSIMTVADATITPGGETRPLPLRKGHEKMFIFSEGCFFEVQGMAPAPTPILRARPNNILFGALNDPRLRIKSAIPLEISVENETVIAFCIGLEEFGYGRSLSEALDDFGKTISELYFSLAGQQAELGEDLKKIQANLRSYIEVRRNPA